MKKEVLGLEKETAIYQPLNDFVLVRRLESETEKGGIFIPEKARERSQKATVVAIGEGRIVNGNMFPINLAIGDEVLITKHGGMDINLDGENFVLVRAAEIYMKKPCGQ